MKWLSFCILLIVVSYVLGETLVEVSNEQIHDKDKPRETSHDFNWASLDVEVSNDDNSDKDKPKVTRYEPNWASLDTRPLPPWYDQDKIGIFIHWGVFSVPSHVLGEWFWTSWKGGDPTANEYMRINYKPDFTYADFAKAFTAELFNPDAWAELFESAGAKYIAFTSKHHEGFCNWNTSYSYNWNSLEVGPKKNLVAELAAAINKRNKIKFGLYHSFFEWYNPLYMKDEAAGYTTKFYPKSKPIPCLYELVNQYKPQLIWSDGDWMANSTYWDSVPFLTWLFNDSPVKDTVVVNDRWGHDAWCKHGSYFNCADKFNPRQLLAHKWENCISLDKGAWGYRRIATLTDILTINEVLESLASTVSCGGNFLLNIGPRFDGSIDIVMEERLRQMGAWLKINGEAIYGSKPWKFQNDTKTPGVWYTMQPANRTVYAIVLNWPANSVLYLQAPNVTKGHTTVEMLGAGPGQVAFEPATGGGVTLTLNPLVLTNLSYAWVFRFTNLNNFNFKRSPSDFAFMYEEVFKPHNPGANVIRDHL